MDIIIKDLKSQIKKTLGIDCILAPQKAKGNTSVIILEFNGIEGAGEPFEKISFIARYFSSGSHESWINGVIKDARKLEELNNEKKIQFLSKSKNLCAVWNRLKKIGFVYSEDETMPVSYMDEFEVSISYPAALIGVCK